LLKIEKNLEKIWTYKDYKRDIGILGNPCHIQG